MNLTNLGFVTLVALAGSYTVSGLGNGYGMRHVDTAECDGTTEFLLHEDCTKYYICDNGVPVLWECPGGLFFNPDSAQCDFYWNVTDCVGGTRDPSGTVPTEPEPIRTSTSSPVDPTTEKPIELTTVVDVTSSAPITEGPGVTCPATGIIPIPDPTDCKKYYVCVEGEAIPQECAEGTLFDPELAKCNLEDQVTCTIQPSCPAEGIVSLPVAGSCTEYIFCVSGEGFPMECAEGTEFSPEAGQCVLESDYECHLRRLHFF